MGGDRSYPIPEGKGASLPRWGRWLPLIGLPLIGLMVTCASLLGSARAYAAPLERPEPGGFLIAAPSIDDPRFHATVIYLLRHDESGSVGLVLNRAAPFSLAEALSGQAFEGSPSWNDEVMAFIGGPVEPGQIFMLLQTEDTPPKAQRISADIHVSVNLETLVWAHAELPPSKIRIFSGYAGWGPGQLAHEIGRGDWQLGQRASDSVFSPPADMWKRFQEANSGLWAQRDAPVYWHQSHRRAMTRAAPSSWLQNDRRDANGARITALHAVYSRMSPIRRKIGMTRARRG